MLCAALVGCGGTKPRARQPTVPHAVAAKAAAKAKPAPSSPAEQRAARARAFEERGVLDRAAQAYGEAFELEKRPRWLLDRADLLAEAWAFKDAAKAYSALLKLPKLAGDMKTRAEKGLAEAKRDAKKKRPIDISDDQASRLETTEERLLRGKHYAAARAALQKAIHGPVDDDVWLDKLAVTYWLQGNRVDAQKTWARARSGLSKSEAQGYGFNIMPPVFDVWSRLALGDRVVATGSVDPGFILYDYLAHRFLGPIDDSSGTKQIVFGKGFRASLGSLGGVDLELVDDLQHGNDIPFETGIYDESHPYPNEDHVTAMAVSRDGRWIAWGGTDGGVRVVGTWSRAVRDQMSNGKGRIGPNFDNPLPDNSPLRKLGAVSSVAFDDSGRLVAAGYDKGAIRVLTTGTAKSGDGGMVAVREIASLEGHTDSVIALSFAPDGKRLFSGSKDHTLRLWDIAHKKQIASLTRGWAVFYVRARTDSQVDFAARSLFRTSLPPSGEPTYLLSRYPGPVVPDPLGISDSPDGKTRATSHDDTDTVELWNAETGALEGGVRADKKDVPDLALSPDGHWFAVATSGAVHLFDLQRGTERALPFHLAKSVAFSADSKLLAAGGPGKIVLWDPATGRVKRRIKAGFKGHDDVSEVGFATDGGTLAAVVEGDERFFNLDSGQASGFLQDVMEFDYAGNTVAVTDAHCGDSPESIRVFDGSPRGKPRYVVEGAAPLSLAADSGWLAGTHWENVVVWDDHGKKKFHMKAPEQVASLALSPSGKWLAVGYDNAKLQVIDIATKRYLVNEPKMRWYRGMRTLRWVAGGKTLVTAGPHGVRFWDPAAKSKPLLATLRLTSDGWYLITTKRGGGGLAKTAGFSSAVVSDVCWQYPGEASVSGGLLWESRRDDRILGHILHCGRASCGK